MTLSLLWLEYRARHPEGYGYSQFCERYRRWARALKPSMRPSLVDGTTGAHVRLVEYFGASAAIWVPDNLKSGVTTANYHEQEINRTYTDLARHNGAIVLPARAAPDRAPAGPHGWLRGRRGEPQDAWERVGREIREGGDGEDRPLTVARMFDRLHRPAVEAIRERRRRGDTLLHAGRGAIQSTRTPRGPRWRALTAPGWSRPSTSVAPRIARPPRREAFARHAAALFPCCCQRRSSTKVSVNRQDDGRH